MGKLLCAMESTNEASDANPPESQGAAGRPGGAAEEGGGPAAGGGHARLVLVRAGLIAVPLSHSCPHLGLTGPEAAVPASPAVKNRQPAAPLLSPAAQQGTCRPSWL